MDLPNGVGIFLFIFILIVMIIIIGALIYTPLFPSPNLCHGDSDCSAANNATGRFCRGNNLCSPTAGVASGAACTSNEDCQVNFLCLGLNNDPDATAKTCTTLS